MCLIKTIIAFMILGFLYIFCMGVYYKVSTGNDVSFAELLDNSKEELSIGKMLDTNE